MEIDKNTHNKQLLIVEKYEQVISYLYPIIQSAPRKHGVASDYPSWVPTGELDSGEWHVMYYQVRGQVDIILDLTALQDILDRIAPAYLEPVFNVDVLSITDTAQAGLGVSGLARSGKE